MKILEELRQYFDLQSLKIVYFIFILIIIGAVRSSANKASIELINNCD